MNRLIEDVRNQKYIELKLIIWTELSENHISRFKTEL